MRWPISLLVAISALSAPPSASAMGLQTVTLGHAAPAVRSQTGSAPRRHAPRHRFTLLDESAGTAVRARPAGRVLGTLAGRTPLGTPTWLWAVAFSRNDGWAQVVMPWRPNGRTGWITTTHIEQAVTGWHIVVDRSQRRATVYHLGKVAKRFRVAVGRRSTPTPAGFFFVEEIVPEKRSSEFWPYALALSARSTVFSDFAGGPGQIAIHGIYGIGGTPGHAESHGCIRATSTALEWMIRHFGTGTPVDIR